MDILTPAESNETALPNDDVDPLEKPYKSPPKNSAELRTTEDLVANAIAPVKVEYLRPPPSRTALTVKVEGGIDNEVDERKTASSGVVKEKKSKRQLKRERKQVSAEESLSFSSYSAIFYVSSLFVSLKLYVF